MELIEVAKKFKVVVELPLSSRLSDKFRKVVLDHSVNFDLFRKLAPDYQPAVSLIETIHELKAGLEAINFNDSNFHDSRFIRLKVLSDLRERGLLNEQLQWQNRR